MEKKLIKHSGSCICGEIKFTVKLDEIPRVFNCHCIDCRKKLGGIISIIQLRDKALEIDESKLSKYSHSGGSKNTITKSFCKNYFSIFICLLFFTATLSYRDFKHMGYYWINILYPKGYFD